MNCPYCDANVHLMSKFCPKCGLPLKDDITIQGGAYATDDTGPSLYVIGGGAAAVLAIALIIGWVSSRGDQKAPLSQVQRQQITNPLAVPNFAPAVPGGNALAVNRGFSAPSTSSANYSPQVKWAYTPSRVQPLMPRIPFITPEPETPKHNLVQEMARAPKERPTVTVARATTPEIPAAPAVPAPINLQPGQTLPEYIETIDETSQPLPALTPEARELEQRGVIVYDPVQERYVIVPGRSRRRSPVREIAPRSPAPATESAPTRAGG